MTRLSIFICLAVSLIAVPATAFAGTPVELRSQPTSHGPSVTLGDVFDGVEGPAASVVVAPAAQVGLDAILDAGGVQALARRAGLDWANASGFRRITVSAEAAETASSRVARGRPGALHRPRANQALTYARNITAGEIVSADDLVWSNEAVSPSDGIADPEAAIGKAARHALRAGAPAAVHDLVAPRIIKRDDLVSVVFESDGINLTLQAKAMGDCSVGDSLEVVNTQSKKVIETICAGPGQAVIGPVADAMKAALTSTGGQGRLVTANLR